MTLLDISLISELTTKNQLTLLYSAYPMKKASTVLGPIFFLFGSRIKILAYQEVEKNPPWIKWLKPHNQRLFRQLLEQKQEKPEEDTGDSPNQEIPPVGWNCCFGGYPVSSSGFLVLLQTLTKQPLIVWLQPLDSGRILLNLLICQDCALISSFWIYSELNQNLVGFWACFSFLSFSTWAYIKQRRKRLINRIY